jgi:hypothetical protein
MQSVSTLRKSRAAVALLAAAYACLAPAVALAKPAAAPSYDGVWTIDATTSSFFCPVRSKRLWAVVQGGQVTKLSGLPATASGRIGPDGAVSFILKLLGVTATVNGKVNGGSGVGDWSSNSFLCARGDWRAYSGK